MTECYPGDWVDTVHGIVMVTERLASGLVATYDVGTHARHVQAVKACDLVACGCGRPGRDHALAPQSSV